MADNVLVRDGTGANKTFRTTTNGGAHVPHHRLDSVTLVGPVAQAAVNTDLLSGDTNGWYEVDGFGSASIQIIASAGITAGAVSFEQTNDPTSAGIFLEADELGVINANPIVAAVTIAASTKRIWAVPIMARYIRVRISTAFAGGTVQAFAELSTQPYASPVLNVQQATAASLAVTATVSGTPNVAAQDNMFWNESVTALAASATLTGTARDVGVAAGAAHRYSAFNAFAYASHAGTMRIEISADNTTWYRATADTAVTAGSVVHLSIPITARYHRVVYVNGATLQTSFMCNTSFTAS